MLNRIRKIIIALVAGLAVATPIALTATPAEAAGSHRVVFRAWGTPDRGMVNTWGNHDITRGRDLPYQKTEYTNTFNANWALMSVEDTRGYRNVGCSITVDGKVVARDVSSYGFAFCAA